MKTQRDIIEAKDIIEDSERKNCEIKERNDRLRERERERGTKRWSEIERKEWRNQISRGQKKHGCDVKLM